MAISMDYNAAADGSQPHSLERRQLPRVAADYTVELFCQGMPCPLPGRMTDFGTGGLCVETLSPFDISLLWRIVIHAPDGPLNCTVEGRWQRENASKTGLLTGIRFDRVERPQLAVINRLVHQRAQFLAEFFAGSELADLELDDALDLALCSRMVQYPVGQPIYRQDTKDAGGDSLFIVGSGTVVLEACGKRGGRVLVDRVGEGGLVVGLPLLSDLPHMETALPDCDCMLYEIDPFTFRYLESSKPELARRVLRSLMRKRATQLSNLLDRVASE